MTEMPKTCRQIARLVDHSLLPPTLTDAEIRQGCLWARQAGTATVCVKPYSIPLAYALLRGSPVGVCAVIGFPHGNSTTSIKIRETVEAAQAGAGEIDMVINVGKALGGDWEYVRAEIQAIQDACQVCGAKLKVIFENDYLAEAHIVRLCEICSAIGVAFVKTSTGFGFVKQPNGHLATRGATLEHLRLMRRHCAPHVQIKAAGGIRTLDQLLAAVEAGADRIGASATPAILDEAARRGYPL